jgi:hypothetical protein
VSGIIKVCSRCSETKDAIRSFYKRSKTAGGGREAVCKDCRRNQDHGRKWRDIRLRYGLSPEAYLDLLESQNRQCYICTITVEETKEGTLCLDHCHTTGRVRGFLCNKCNTALGLFKDNTENLLRAIQYLEKK